MLAARILLDQGMHVEAVTFDSPFFDVDAGRKAAAALGIPWRAVDITPEILAMLEDPPSGFGKNMNPCIDCHAAMFTKLKEIAIEEGFHFIFSGEVMGQRPMSQNKGSLNRVKNISNTGDMLLRPLSAKILEPTPMETSGMVDRSRLLGISGRGRSVQLALASEYGFAHVPAPAGGCLLTDPGYSLRLRVLMEQGLLSAENAGMIRYGRMFVLNRAVALVGRDEADNERLRRTGCGHAVDLREVPGPLGVLLGDTSPENIRLLASIVASYAKRPGPFLAETEAGEIKADKMPPEERNRYAVVL